MFLERDRKRRNSVERFSSSDRRVSLTSRFSYYLRREILPSIVPQLCVSIRSRAKTRTGRSEGIRAPFLVISFLYFSSDGIERARIALLSPSLSLSFSLYLSLSSSLSFARPLLVFSAWPTERERKIERSRARGGGWKTLTRISLQAREESTGEESEGQDQENERRRRYKKSARKREREGKKQGTERGTRTPREKSSRSPSHTRSGWLTHHYRQFINSQ